MHRIILVAVMLLSPLTAQGEDQPLCLAEQYLHSGEFVAGETALQLALDANPENDQLRFGLATIQFMRAIEHLGQALYDYGALSGTTNAMLLRLPVPKNEHPSVLSYTELGRVLDCLYQDLGRAEATLAAISDDNVKLPIRLASIKFRFARGERQTASLLEILSSLDVRVPEDATEFRFHFDRGDVAWLRAYCHLLMACVDIYRAFDEEAGFEERVKHVFPNLEATAKAAPDWQDGLTIVDAPRLRRMRLHLLAVCELNLETWKHIRAEKDDDYEWLPNADQMDLLGLPVSKRQVDAWLAAMSELGKLLRGETLLPSALLGYVSPPHKIGMGLNVKRLFDDPPLDMLNQRRLKEDGIDAKYLESESDKDQMDVITLITAFQLFNSPFGFARAARMN